MNSKTLKYILNFTVLGGLIFAAVKYLNGKDVLAALQKFNYAYVPILLLISAAYILLKSYRFVPLMQAVSKKPWGVYFRGYLAGTAATLLPGGIAARAGLMEQAGVPVEKSAAPVTYSSAIDQGVFIAESMVAALFFPAARLPSLILLGILTVFIALLVIPVTRGWLGSLAEKIAGHFHAEKKWKSFLKSMRVVATPKVLAIAVGITILGDVLQFLNLYLCLKGVGLTVAIPTIFLSYTLPTMFGRISILPAGVGLTEAGMVGFMSKAAGTDPNTTAAAVAVFRIVTVLFQALLGALVYLLFWRGEHEASRTSTSKE